MLSYIAEPLRRIFATRNEETNRRKRSTPSMNFQDQEKEGPSRKRPCNQPIRQEHKFLPDPASSGNCVQDWFNKIRQMASMPLPSLNFSYVQSAQDYLPEEEEEDEDDDDESQGPVVLNGEKNHLSKALTREPLHQERKMNGSEEPRVNGKWKETLEVSNQIVTVPSTSHNGDGSVRHKKKSFYVRREPGSDASDDSPPMESAKPMFFKKYCSRIRPLQRTSTPLEPIRLDEKEQYRMLLEQCKVGSQLEPSSENGSSRSFLTSSAFHKPLMNGDHVSLKKISDVSRKSLMDRIYLGSDFASSNLFRSNSVHKENSTKLRKQKYVSLGTDVTSSSSSDKAKGQRDEVTYLGTSSRFYNGSKLHERLSMRDMQETVTESKERRSSLVNLKESHHHPKRNSMSVFDKPLFSPGWLNDVQLSLDDSFRSRIIKQEKLEKKAKEMREKREAKIFTENRKSLHRLAKSLNLKPSEDEEEETSHLPEMSPEMQQRIDQALRLTPPEEVLCTGFGLSIARRDMETLSGLNWLNDEIINFYMNLLMERGKNDNFPSVYAFNTFFYPKLISGGHGALRRWTRKVDIFSHNYVLIPVHLGMHWCLAVIDFKQHKIQYYDSMGGQNNDCMNALKTYLKDEMRDKKKEEYDMSDWKFEMVKNIPQQMNGSDCGMFTLKYAEYITRNAKITFSQRHMPYFRRRMVYEIVTKTLL